MRPCQHCKAAIPNNRDTCPACGKSQTPTVGPLSRARLRRIRLEPGRRRERHDIPTMYVGVGLVVIVCVGLVGQIALGVPGAVGGALLALIFLSYVYGVLLL